MFRRSSALLVAIMLIVAQTAQAADPKVFRFHISQVLASTEIIAVMAEEGLSEPESSIRTTESDVAVTAIDTAGARATVIRAQSPGRTHRHTLRNIVIIVVVVGVLYVILGSAAKK